MSSTRLPWFPFYADDWLASGFVTGLPLDEQAGYLRLRCHQWNDPDCGLEDDDEVLASLSGLGLKWKSGAGKRIRKAFKQHPEKQGFICDPKVYDLRKQQEKLHAAKVAAGAKGAKKRWQSDGAAIADPSQSYGSANDLPIAKAWQKDTEAEAEAEAAAKEETPPPAPPQGGALKTDGIAAAAPEKRPEGEEPKPPSARADLEKPNFAVAMRLLMAAPVSLARSIALEYSGEIPLREVAAVIEASRSQRNPGGWARDALEQRWRKDANLYPDQEEALRGMVEESAQRSMKLVLSDSSSLSKHVSDRKDGETEDAYITRVNARMKSRQRGGRADG